MSADLAIQIDSVHIFVQFVGHQLFLVREIEKYYLNYLNHIFYNFFQQKIQMTVNCKKNEQKKTVTLLFIERIKIF